MRPLIRAFIVLFILLLAACTTIPGKMIFRETEPVEKWVYVSKEDPSLMMSIPGIDWKIYSVTDNHTLLSSAYKRVNILEYSDGLLIKRFFKSGASEEQALEEFYKVESAHHLSQHTDWQSEILARNIDGINLPNMLWKVEGPTAKIVWLTTSRHRHLIVVSWQNTQPPAHWGTGGSENS